MAEAGENEVELRLIGPVAVLRGGVVQPAPRSRKTRALLAYLALTGKPVRRERLCELFWDLPDDPRGALRWSLSKLRAWLADPEGRYLQAERDQVALSVTSDASDWERLRFLVQSGLGQADTAALEAAASPAEPLEGLDLPGCPSFQAWCVAQREDVRLWRAALFAELGRRDLSPDRKLAGARLWVEADAGDPAAWQNLIERLEQSGRLQEAEEQKALGARALAEAERPVPSALRRRSTARPAPASPSEEIAFCTSRDGTSLAYAMAGRGPPVVKIANWMTHLERDREGPIWRHWIREFSREHSLLRYDQRGNGLSDRHCPISFDHYVDDLEAVVDAAGLEKFDLLGLSQGASVAIAFAARHPGRVGKLLLLGGFARGWASRSDSPEAERRQAMLTLTREGWPLENPAFRRMFTSLFLPEGDEEAQDWFTEMQRLTTSADNACAMQRVSADTDISALLPAIDCPTLVAHCRDDAMVPFEAGRALARGIRGARFLPLEGRNHVLLEEEPAWQRFLQASRAFLRA